MGLTGFNYWRRKEEEKKARKAEEVKNVEAGDKEAPETAEEEKKPRKGKRQGTNKGSRKNA